jgi:TolB-like protein
MKEFAEALVTAEAEATITRTAARRSATGARRTATREVAAPVSPPAGRNRNLYFAGGALALLLLAGGAWAALRHRGAASPPLTNAGGLDAHRVAVLYFQDLDPRDSLGYLADGLTEGLIRRLGDVQTLDVISSNGVAPYRSDSIPRDSVARALKAGTLVQGGIERSGGRIRVSVRLIDGASGADYKRVSFEQPAANVLGIQDSLVEQVAELIRSRLGEEFRLREQRESTSSPQAWLLVQRAQEARKRAEASLTQSDGGNGAERSFGEADSIYALAQRADPRWAEPLVGRATLAYRRSRMAGQDPLAAKGWIEKGVAFADSALALSPQDPDALEARGTLRYWGWLLGLEPDPVESKKLLADA